LRASWELVLAGVVYQEGNHTCLGEHLKYFLSGATLVVSA